MRVLVCGSRRWTNYKLVAEALDQLFATDPELVIIEGGATGADRFGRRWAEKNQRPFWEFPAEWNRLGKSAGFTRNGRMLIDAEPDLVLAFTSDLQTSRGTADMVRRAVQADVEVQIIGDDRTTESG